MLPHDPFSALPPVAINQRYTLIYFGENQLSPGSFGILPLTSSHLNPLLRIRVRSSSRISAGLNLLKVSSPGFGFIDCYCGSPVRACFHCVFPTKLVKLCSNQKLTGSFFNRHNVRLRLPNSKVKSQKSKLSKEFLLIIAKRYKITFDI